MIQVVYSISKPTYTTHFSWHILVTSQRTWLYSVFPKKVRTIENNPYCYNFNVYIAQNWTHARVHKLLTKYSRLEFTKLLQIPKGRKSIFTKIFQQHLAILDWKHTHHPKWCQDNLICLHGFDQIIRHCIATAIYCVYFAIYIHMNP